MNTFTKAIFLMLAAGSAAAHEVGVPGALRAQISDAADSNNKPSEECVPDERPQTKSKSADKTRFRWNYEKNNAVCADEEDVTYEYGEFKKVEDSDECADMCTNDTGNLNNVVRGFNFDCDKQYCQCLYDAGTINQNNVKRFDNSNYTNRSRKGEGPVSRTVKTNNWVCFKLVGAELSGEGLEMLHKTHKFLQSIEN